MNKERLNEFFADPSTFDTAASDPDLWLDALARVIYCADSSHSLRDAQSVAWCGMKDQRVSLLLGPPGTGKTATLAWMAAAYASERRAAKQSCRILVCAFTKNAIITLLEAITQRIKALDAHIDVHYLGYTGDMVLPDGISTSGLRDAKEILDHDAAVVGCTTWGVAKMLANQAVPHAIDDYCADGFDLVLLDEASQMPVAQALMALAAMKPFGRAVLAGDNRQLGPIGQSFDWDADERALSGSIYDFLYQKVTEHRLNETFRLNAPLCSYPSERFYGEDYSPATPEIAQRRLNLKQQWQDGLERWASIALNPDLPVVVLLYDGHDRFATTNSLEQQWIAQLTRAFYQRSLHGDDKSFWEHSLAVISPHRAQNVALRWSLQHDTLPDGVIAETVEKIQGNERDVIFFSFTVSDPEFAASESDFLFDPTRFNVAFTRARTKLVVILSRSLLDVVVSDEAVLDHVNELREFVFGLDHVGAFTDRIGTFDYVNFDIYIKGFEPDAADALADPKPVHPLDVTAPLPPFTERLQRLDGLVRRLCQDIEKRPYGNVPQYDQELERFFDGRPTFEDMHNLMRLGRIRLSHRSSSNGGFWVMEPQDLDEIRAPFACTLDVVRARLPGCIQLLRSSNIAPFHWNLCHFFVWVDEEGCNVFAEHLETLREEGWIISDEGRPLELQDTSRSQFPLDAPHPQLLASDYDLLNRLEDLEVRLINFGLFESWHDATDLIHTTHFDETQINEAMRRLETHGHVMIDPDRDGHYRSRMAEMARELRYIKQRFGKRPIDKSPYLVRSLKLIAKTRAKPARDTPLEPIIDRLKESLSMIDHAEDVLDAMHDVLKSRWAEVVDVSGFQARAIEELTNAWFGCFEDNESWRSAVITADTGAGKTEASCLPLIIGAAIDAKRGINGMRAALIYPRIRLATNQAARLVSYLAALADQLGGEPLRIALQSSQTPSSFDWLRKNDDELWQLAEGTNTSNWKFPLFRCPKCGVGELILQEVHGPADRLVCTNDEHHCDWKYEGWVGSQQKLRDHPPHFFLVITESLHQWMQDDRYARLFGDLDQNPSQLRAVLADEIHLYSLVPGAQVGYAIQRLVARAELNAQDTAQKPLRIGMSATLGRPESTWANLIGERETVRSFSPKNNERKDNAKGREYFYFVQPEVESRGHDIAGASTTIQALMCLSHNMRRRTGNEGGFRGIAFLDSLDKLKRLHGDFRDAEHNRRLAALRTLYQNPDTQNDTEPMVENGCCNSPSSCDAFRKGECWYFAANDEHQWGVSGRYIPGDHVRVGHMPIHSGGGGNADRIVGNSDLVFSTSSLEVGFDDPDMTLVYQHYAPANPASFVQRKGRGGRGANDRPVTGVTLSVYSPRDTENFRQPEKMLSAEHFEVPLNMDNFFVRRGQVLSAFIDFLARAKAKDGMNPQPYNLPAQTFTEATTWLQSIFGQDIFAELEVDSLRGLWQQVLNEVTDLDLNRARYDNGRRRAIPRAWREDLLSIPTTLFESINLPTMTVAYMSENGEEQERVEDVTLGLAECAPGRMTRRWDSSHVHWNPFRGPLAPFLTRGSVYRFDLADDVKRAERLLPESAVRMIQTSTNQPIPTDVWRPLKVPVERAGTFHYQEWRPELEYDERTKEIRPIEDDSKNPTLHHKTQGRMLGTIVVSHDWEHARHIRSETLKRISKTGELRIFRSDAQNSNKTGLHAFHVFWGSDVELVLERPNGRRTKEYTRQIFWSDKTKESALLFGYDMHAEGVAFEVDDELLCAFVDCIAEEFQQNKDSHECSWHLSQYFRYLLISRCAYIGMTYFEAEYLAELIVAAAGDRAGGLRDRLQTAIKELPNMRRLAAVLRDTRAGLLNAHPTMTEARVNSLCDKLNDFDNLDSEIRASIKEVKKDDRLKSYLKSVVLHGLCIRYKHLFISEASGNERKVLMHAALPVEMGEHAHHTLTVCEKGSGGDGTTRSFALRASQAFERWETEGVSPCPNARVDAIVESAFSQHHLHHEWENFDRRDPMTSAHIAQAIGIDRAHDTEGIQRVVELFYDSITYEGVRYQLREIYGEIRSVREELEHNLQRGVGTWELVSQVVSIAEHDSTQLPVLNRLRQAYAQQDPELQDDSLSPESRLADIVYRYSSRLCPDGCLACLHQGSDIIPDRLVPALTSRRLLEKFWTYAKAQRAEQTPQNIPESPQPEYFAHRWQLLLADLGAIENLEIQPGKDIAGANGRVVGHTLMRLVDTNTGTSLILMDRSSPGASDAMRVLKATGQRVMFVEPMDAVNVVLRQLREQS